MAVKIICMTKNTQNSIKWTCNEIRDLLISKNKDYGDSALHPDNIFSKLDNAQAICARIDDIIGYLILLKIARSNATARATVYTCCNCEHGCNICSNSCECSCNVELNTNADGTFADHSQGYAPPWSHEVEKVTVFADKKKMEMKK